MLKYINIGLRVLLVILGAVVAGLSATLAKHQVHGSVPGQTSFGTFTGGFGIVASLIGLAAVLVESIIPSVLVLVLDAVSTGIYLAAGVVIAAAMKGIDCQTKDSESWEGMLKFPLFSGGETVVAGGQTVYGIMDGYLSGKSSLSDIEPELRGRCVRAQTDYSVMFVAAAFGVGVLALSVLRRRKEKQSAV